MVGEVGDVGYAGDVADGGVLGHGCEGGGALGHVGVALVVVCVGWFWPSEILFVMPPSSSRQVQSWFVVSFMNKGDVEVGTRRQSGGLGLRGRIRSRRAKRSQCQHGIVAAVK